MADFEKRLSHSRQERGLSYADAAERIGISEQRYKDYEFGAVYASFVERLGLLVGLGHEANEARQLAEDPDSMSLGDSLHGSSEEILPFARMDDGVIQIFDHGLSGMIYEFSADRIQSPEFVMRWIEHLGEKTWVTKEHLQEFVRVCSDHLGTSLHPCS